MSNLMHQVDDSTTINLNKQKLDYKLNKIGSDNKNFDSELNDSDTSPINHPKYAQFFKKRVCFKFVKDAKSNLCSGCMQKETEGGHEKISQTEWNYKTCTRLMTTDAYGKLNFPGSHSKTASYIRVQNETKTKDMIQYLYSQDGWNLQKPQLILSVTGGAQKFSIPLRMKKAFKRGLIKAAASTGAWIITGGTNTGVMRLVGEAVADEFHTCNITVLGIATWGKIAFRDQMIRKNSRTLNTTYSLNEINKEAQQVRENGNIYKKEPLFYAQQECDEHRKSQTRNTDVLLDANHTHFILVDDGSEGQFGKEIEFRAHLEAELRKGKSPKYYEIKRTQSKKKLGWTASVDEIEQDMDDISDDDNSRNETVPMILIVVQGGPNTLLTVEESLKQNVPVLVLADSKGCADLIANACSSSSSADRATLQKLLTESKMFANRIGTPDYEKVTLEAVKRLEYIISKIEHNLINVFHLDSEEGGSDIELTILRAFLNSRKNQYYENLKLALQWNRSDIAKTDIFTGEEEFKPYQLANLMEMALIQNKPEFVELLLENGLNLKSFLTVRRLCFLYNSNKIQNDARKQPLFQLYKKKYSPDYSVKIKLTITFKGLLKFLKDFVLEDFEPSFLPTDLDSTQLQRFLHYSNKNESSDISQIDSKDTTLEVNFGKNEVLYPQQNLFLWALLLNRIDIAKLFWQIDEHQICSALFASKLLKSMSKRLTDLEKELDRYANYFEEMAIGVLNIFDATTDDLINGVILLRKIPFYNLDSLQMAVIADCKTFISLSSVQNLLTDIWNGKIVANAGWKAGIKNDREAMLKKLSTYSKKKNITNLLKDYLTNYEITIDKKESNLLPSFCITDTSSGSSNSSEESTDSELFKSEVNSVSSTNKKKIMNRSKKYTKRVKVAKQTKWSTYWNRYKRFLHSPFVHFIYDTIFNLVFIILFSYMILCEFTYIENVREYIEIKNVTKNSDLNEIITISNRTYSYITVNKLKSPSFIEYLLVYWMFAFMMEEFRQYVFGDSETKILKNKLRHYFENQWNFADLSGCLVFVIGMGLRFISLRTNESLFKAARIVLCIDLIIWYFRLLHFFIVFKSLGPKLVMIEKMARDLMFFISIILIFICLFGVITQATLYPGNKLDFALLVNIFDKAYWPIYGELRILEELEECSQENDKNRICPEPSGVAFSYLLLVIYMLIANILLINLLIAMFSSTFQDVQENTDKIWKFQRYRFIFEYYDSPILPPPLNFIAYFLSTISYLKNKHFKSNPQLNLQIQAEEMFDNSAKDEIDLLLDRERKYAEEYLRMEKFKQKESMDSRLKSNVEKLETLEQKLNEVIEARFRESNQVSDAINWIMTQMVYSNEHEKLKAPVIKNIKSNRKTK